MKNNKTKKAEIIEYNKKRLMPLYKKGFVVKEDPNVFESRKEANEAKRNSPYKNIKTSQLTIRKVKGTITGKTGYITLFKPEIIKKSRK
jgi:hypothetical protein